MYRYDLGAFLLKPAAANVYMFCRTSDKITYQKRATKKREWSRYTTQTHEHISINASRCRGTLFHCESAFADGWGIWNSLMIIICVELRGIRATHLIRGSLSVCYRNPHFCIQTRSQKLIITGIPTSVAPSPGRFHVSATSRNKRTHHYRSTFDRRARSVA